MMKKLITVTLILALLLPAVALADLPDITGMTDQELKDLISACSQELRARNTSEPEGILIFEYEGVRVYQTGDVYFDNRGYLNFPVAVYNDTEHEMVISIEDATCNGWDVSALNCRATGKAKHKDDLSIKVIDADVTSIDQIESLAFRWKVLDFTDLKEIYLQEEKEEHRFW
jgi:hypothetical protein